MKAQGAEALQSVEKEPPGQWRQRRPWGMFIT